MACFAGRLQCKPLTVLYGLPEVPRLANGVPMIIHQTWKTEDVPSHWATSSEAWKALHPDWIYLLWTDADIEAYIEALWPDAVPIFERLEEPIQRVDLWRYFVLRDFGGIYCDLDIRPKDCIGPVLEASPGHVFLVPSANNAGQFTNALMASGTSMQAQVFWTEMIDYVAAWPNRPFDHIAGSIRHVRIVASTGPLALSRVAENTQMPITVLPKVVWNPYELTVAGHLDEQKSPHAIVEILKGSSWHDAESTVFVFLHMYRLQLLALLGLLVVFTFIQNAYLRDYAKYLVRRLRNYRRPDTSTASVASSV